MQAGRAKVSTGAVGAPSTDAGAPASSSVGAGSRIASLRERRAARGPSHSSHARALVNKMSHHTGSIGDEACASALRFSSAYWSRQLRTARLLRTRRHMFVPYQSCFIGSEFVSWLVSTGRASSRTHASFIGETLRLNNVLHHVLDEHKFTDSNLFYRFNADDPEGVARYPVSELMTSRDHVIGGWFMKQGQVFLNQRYFVLDGDKKRLYVYTSDISPSPRYFVQLTPECKVISNAPKSELALHRSSSMPIPAMPMPPFTPRRQESDAVLPTKNPKPSPAAAAAATPAKPKAELLVGWGRPAKESKQEEVEEAALALHKQVRGSLAGAASAPRMPATERGVVRVVPAPSPSPPPSSSPSPAPATTAALPPPVPSPTATADPHAEPPAVHSALHTSATWHDEDTDDVVIGMPSEKDKGARSHLLNIVSPSVNIVAYARTPKQQRRWERAINDVIRGVKLPALAPRPLYAARVIEPGQSYNKTAKHTGNRTIIATTADVKRMPWGGKPPVLTASSPLEAPASAPRPPASSARPIRRQSLGEVTGARPHSESMSVGRARGGYVGGRAAGAASSSRGRAARVLVGQKPVRMWLSCMGLDHLYFDVLKQYAAAVGDRQRIARLDDADLDAIGVFVPAHRVALKHTPFPLTEEELAGHKRAGADAGRGQQGSHSVSQRPRSRSLSPVMMGSDGSSLPQGSGESGNKRLRTASHGELLSSKHAGSGSGSQSPGRGRRPRAQSIDNCTPAIHVVVSTSAAAAHRLTAMGEHRTMVQSFALEAGTGGSSSSETRSSEVSSSKWRAGSEATTAGTSRSFHTDSLSPALPSPPTLRGVAVGSGAGQGVGAGAESVGGDTPHGSAEWGPGMEAAAAAAKAAAGRSSSAASGPTAVASGRVGARSSVAEGDEDEEDDEAGDQAMAMMITPRSTASHHSSSSRGGGLPPRISSRSSVTSHGSGSSTSSGRLRPEAQFHVLRAQGKLKIASLFTEYMSEASIRGRYERQRSLTFKPSWPVSWRRGTQFTPSRRLREVTAYGCLDGWLCYAWACALRGVEALAAPLENNEAEGRRVASARKRAEEAMRAASATGVLLGSAHISEQVWATHAEEEEGADSSSGAEQGAAKPPTLQVSFASTNSLLSLLSTSPSSTVPGDADSVGHGPLHGSHAGSTPRNGSESPLRACVSPDFELPVSGRSVRAKTFTQLATRHMEALLLGGQHPLSLLLQRLACVTQALHGPVGLSSYALSASKAARVATKDAKMALVKLQQMLTDLPQAWARIMRQWGEWVKEQISLQLSDDLDSASQDACRQWLALSEAACGCSLRSRGAEAVCRGALYKVFFKVTGTTFAQLYQRLYADDATRLRSALKTTEDHSLHAVHLSDDVLLSADYLAQHSHRTPFHGAIRALGNMCSALNPDDKVKALVAIIDSVCDTVQHYVVWQTSQSAEAGGDGSAAGTGAQQHASQSPRTVRISADDLVGLVRYCIAQCKPAQLLAHLALMESFMSEEDALQKPGFYMTTVQMAVQYMLQVAGEKQEAEAEAAVAASKLAATAHPSGEEVKVAKGSVDEAAAVEGEGEGVIDA